MCVHIHMHLHITVYIIWVGYIQNITTSVHLPVLFRSTSLMGSGGISHVSTVLFHSSLNVGLFLLLVVALSLELSPMPTLTAANTALLFSGLYVDVIGA